jgi:hypothetical protein
VDTTEFLIAHCTLTPLAACISTYNVFEGYNPWLQAFFISKLNLYCGSDVLDEINEI